MKPFEEFIVEAEDDSTDAKRNTINFIVSNFYRFINNNNDGDDRALLMLIGALSVLNTSDDTTAIQAARRLTQMALVRRGK